MGMVYNIFVYITQAVEAMDMNIVVLAGGLSPERDVSLSSGCLIANALMDNGHKVLLLDLFTGLKETETYDAAYQKYRKDRYSYVVPETEPDLEQLMAEHGTGSTIGENVLSICRSADIVFLALHGSIGENGQIQAMFDTLNITYTGTGYTGSLLAMNKIISKELMSYHKIKTPEWTVIDGKQCHHAPFLPCVMKPISCGSSIGISIVETEAQFMQAVHYASQYDCEIFIERKIIGREFSVGILDKKALPVIEIMPKQGFYDYKNKYQGGLTEEICPAKIDRAMEQNLQALAWDIHKILRLGSYSRIDFMVDENNDIYCLEANTLPGMTPTSLLPQEAKALGISYEDLCERIVGLSDKRKFEL